MTKRYLSPVMASIHETAEGLHAAGVMDKQTMRKFDDACLTPLHPLALEPIRSRRERKGAGQAVFVRRLKITTSLISQWERGERRPNNQSHSHGAYIVIPGRNAM
jgi:putative transcriptional regulator